MKMLQGTRILDLGAFITGPFAALLLAEMGADVIKVEWPTKGDKFRADEHGLYSPQFQAHNRDKRSITLDYSIPAGREVLHRLVRSADALISNSRPGVMEKVGADYASLQAGQSEADLLCHHRVRSERSIRQPSGIRHRRTGAVGLDEPSSPGG